MVKVTMFLRTQVFISFFLKEANGSPKSVFFDSIFAPGPNLQSCCKCVHDCLSLENLGLGGCLEMINCIEKKSRPASVRFILY